MSKPDSIEEELIDLGKLSDKALVKKLRSENDSALLRDRLAQQISSSHYQGNAKRIELLTKIALLSHDSRLSKVALLALSKYRLMALFLLAVNPNLSENKEQFPLFVHDVLCPLLENIKLDDLRQVDDKQLDRFIILLTQVKSEKKQRYLTLEAKCQLAKEDVDSFGNAVNTIIAVNKLSTQDELNSLELSPEQGAEALINYFEQGRSTGSKLRARAKHWAGLFGNVEKARAANDQSHSAMTGKEHTFFLSSHENAPRDSCFMREYYRINQKFKFFSKEEHLESRDTQAAYFGFTTATELKLEAALVSHTMTNTKTASLLQAYSASHEWGENESNISNEAQDIYNALNYFNGRSATPLRCQKFKYFMDVLLGDAYHLYEIKSYTESKAKSDTSESRSKKVPNPKITKIYHQIDISLNRSKGWFSHNLFSLLNSINQKFETNNFDSENFKEVLRKIVSFEHMGTNRLKAEATRFGCIEQFEALQDFLNEMNASDQTPVPAASSPSQS